MSRKSACYATSNDQFIEAVKNSFSIAEVLRKLGLSPFGASYRSFRIRIKDLQLDTSHFKGQGHMQGKKHTYNKSLPLEEVLVENSTYKTGSIKRRLLAANIWKNECSQCYNSEWQGQQLSLQVDHINGINTDNRIENLRLLCPNCHSLTPTFCRKKSALQPISPKQKKVLYRDNVQVIPKLCEGCDKPIQRSYNKRTKKEARVCKTCYNKNRKKWQDWTPPTKINWVSNDELGRLIWEVPATELAKQWGVSDRAIIKRCQKLGITTPGRGYWAKKAAGKL